MVKFMAASPALFPATTFVDMIHMVSMHESHWNADSFSVLIPLSEMTFLPLSVSEHPNCNCLFTTSL